MSARGIGGRLDRLEKRLKLNKGLALSSHVILMTDGVLHDPADADYQPPPGTIMIGPVDFVSPLDDDHV